jgi:hypothetical protein
MRPTRARLSLVGLELNMNLLSSCSGCDVASKRHCLRMIVCHTAPLKAQCFHRSQSAIAPRRVAAERHFATLPEKTGPLSGKRGDHAIYSIAGLKDPFNCHTIHTIRLHWRLAVSFQSPSQTNSHSSILENMRIINISRSLVIGDARLQTAQFPDPDCPSDAISGNNHERLLSSNHRHTGFD